MKFRIAIIGLAFLATTACVKSQTEGVTLSNTVTFEQKLNDDGVQLIDVRTAEEFNSGHLANAKNIDIKLDDFEQKIAALDKTKPVMVYCKSGGRSGRAATKLKELGFTTIVDLDGGITDWKAEGKPVEN
ncbi:rhodanese-like domain-containing protein [Flavobacterium sp.]|uniref:rhodanese-like domain-containing protein n=1 Tax=Flavobacterium sp. TaxID=239 RepID=UPI0040470A77